MLELTGFFSLRSQIDRLNTDEKTTAQRRIDAINKARQQSEQEVLDALETADMKKAELMAATGLASSTIHEVTKRLLEQKRIRVVRTYMASGNKAYVFGIVECE